LAYQRMGLIAGQVCSMGPGGSGQISSRCLDEHDDPPFRDDEYAQVMLSPSTPDAVMVQIDGKELPLQQALDLKLVRLSGVTQGGNHGRIDALHLQNLTNKAVTVRIKHNAIVGAAGESRPIPVNLEAFLGTFGPGKDQRGTWRDISKLQTTSSDSARSGADQASRDAAMNAAQGDGRFYIIEQGRNGQLYTLKNTYNESEILSANEMLPIVARIKTDMSRYNTTSVYIDANKISRNRLEPLAFNLRQYFDLDGSGNSLRLMQQGWFSGAARSAYFRPGFTITKVGEIQAPKEPSGAYSLYIKLKTGTLRAFSRTSEFLRSFRDFFRRNAVEEPNLSPADAVEKAIKDARKSMPGMSDEQIRIEFSKAFGKIHVTSTCGAQHESPC